jgi:hypothetical protein
MGGYLGNAALLFSRRPLGRKAMANSHHFEPTPHDPGKPHDGEPDTHPEEHPGEGEGWGFDPLVANPFRIDNDLVLIKPQDRDIFILPEPVPNAPDPPPELRAFTEAAKRIQEPFNLSVAGLDPTAKKIWEGLKEVAGSYKACLPDYWKDVVTAMHDMVARTEDKTERAAAKKTLSDPFKTEAEFLMKLSEWDKERRKYPFDWKALSGLQNELNSQLSSYLDKLKQIEGTTITTKLGSAVEVGKTCFSALGFELGRQGAELTNSTAIEIYYGSASEAAADSLVVNTGQNSAAKRLIDGQALEGFWKNNLSLPKSVASSSTGSRWNKEVIEPMVEKLSDWIKATTANQLDYDGLINLTKNVLVESYTQRGSLDTREIANIPDYLRDQARDALSLLSDGMVNQLNKLRDGANLEQRQNLDQLLEEVKILREDTKTERLAREAADKGLSDFWSESKNQILVDIENNVTDGKTLKGSLETAFNENLGGLLDKWSAEMKKVPKHSAEALHEATWNIRFAVRRYRNTVNAILKAQPSEKYRLLTSLDALQVAVSNRLRQAYLEGYYLF